MKSEDLINAYYMLQCKTELTCQCDKVSECQQCWEDRKNESDLNALENSSPEY